MERKRSFRRRKQRKPFSEKCKDYLRKFAAFMFSNVGIIGLVVGYTIAGAFIFTAIEGHTEQEVKINILTSRNQTINRLWEVTYNLNVLYRESWRNAVEVELFKYQKDIIEAARNGYDGSDDVDEFKQWRFAGGFLYSLTVITTIGYGNILPRTPWGKVATIIYAIIGMPLFLLYLSNIGDIMAGSFKWIYAKCCLCRCCPGVARRRAERRRRRALQLSIEYINSRVDSRNSSELSQIGVHNSHLEEYRLNSLGGSSSDDEEEEEESDGVTETDVSYDSQAVTVPLTICLAIMVGYICGGAILFSRYEDWNLLDGSYFCFISLSTIGFGDIVPGDKIYSGKVYELSFVFCSMYLMLGMALIAMCFNLMQEEVIHKIRTTMRTVRYILRCNR